MLHTQTKAGRLQRFQVKGNDLSATSWVCVQYGQKLNALGGDVGGCQLQRRNLQQSPGMQNWNFWCPSSVEDSLRGWMFERQTEVGLSGSSLKFQLNILFSFVCRDVHQASTTNHLYNIASPYGYDLFNFQEQHALPDPMTVTIFLHSLKVILVDNLTSDLSKTLYVSTILSD